MRTRYRRALDLLMSKQSHEVAEEMGVKQATIERWMRSDQFREALREREREQERSLTRLAREASVRAARALCECASEGAKIDAKVLLEIVKASGAFDAESADGLEELDQVMRRVREGLSADAQGQ